MRLVIGYGSTLRGDDGIGHYVAHALAERINDPDIEVLACHQLTPELAEPMSRADLVVFIDACEGCIPGEIRLCSLEADHSSGSVTHNVNPATLLAASQIFYGCSPRAYLCSICGTNFEYGQVPSPDLINAIPGVVRRLKELLLKGKISPEILNPEWGT